MLMLRSTSVRLALTAARHLSSSHSKVATSMRTHAHRSGGGGDTLGRRLFSLVYNKRSAVVAIAKWKEEGHTVQKYQLNRIVRELRKLKRYNHALEICEWMTQQHDIKLLPGDYAVHLDLVAKIRGLPSAEKFFEDLPDKMRGHETCTALLHVYARNKLVDKAEALMEKMSECGFLKNPLPHNHMLTLYLAVGQVDKLAGVVKELKNNTSPDIVTYNLLLTAFASDGDVESAEKILLELKKKSLDPDWMTYSTLTNLYIKEELHEKAASSLKEMEKLASRKNRAAYSSLLSLHTNMGDKDGVHRIWTKMGSLFRQMNDTEYICAISSLVKLGEFKEAKKLYTKWESVSTSGDPRVSNLILAAYINRGQMDEAENFYKHMVEKGIRNCYTTWELLTWGNLKAKQVDKVLEYLEEAINSVKSWAFDEKLVGEVLKNLEEQGNIEGAEKLLVILRKVGHVSTKIYNSLLRTYANAGKIPLIVAERMESDNVELDEETHKLIKATSNMCVSEVSSCLS